MRSGVEGRGGKGKGWREGESEEGGEREGRESGWERERETECYNVSVLTPR